MTNPMIVGIDHNLEQVSILHDRWTATDMQIIKDEISGTVSSMIHNRYPHTPISRINSMNLIETMMRCGRGFGQMSMTLFKMPPSGSISEDIDMLVTFLWPTKGLIHCGFYRKEGNSQSSTTEQAC